MARVGSIVFLTLAICGAGTALFHELEGWSVLDSLYFTVVTLTSVGYGDFSPTQGKPFSRAAAVALALLGMGIISALVDAIGDMQQKFFGRFAVSFGCSRCVLFHRSTQLTSRALQRIGSLAWILAALAVLVGTAVIVLPRLEPHLSGEDVSVAAWCR